MPNLLADLLATRDWLLTDGATGTNLMGMGLSHGYPPELWNVEHPDKIRQHYRSFIEAGSDIVLTNTFGGTSCRLKLHKAEHRVAEINRASTVLLVEEIRRSGRPIVAAGSIGPTGELFQPLGEMSHVQGVAAFAEQMQGLKDGGADVAWIETMFSEPEIAAAVEAAAIVGLPAVVTLSFDTSGRTMMGLSPADFVKLTRAMPARLVAFGGNCGTGAPDLLCGLISISGMLTPGEVVVAKANCGLPEFVNDQVCYNGTPELMASYAVMARDAGARIIGGCCGTTPHHVAVMRKALEQTPKGRCPTIEDVIARIGPLTGSARTLVEGGAPVKRVGRRRAT
jgi:5-methyltetrahydrofolate--homocysteine methyltransferase